MLNVWTNYLKCIKFDSETVSQIKFPSSIRQLKPWGLTIKSAIAATIITVKSTTKWVVIIIPAVITIVSIIAVATIGITTTVVYVGSGKGNYQKV